MRSRTGIERTQISPRRGRSSLRIGGVILLVLFLAAGAGLGAYRHHNLHFDDGRMDALHDAGFVEKQAKEPSAPYTPGSSSPQSTARALVSLSSSMDVACAASTVTTPTPSS